ncbi:MAG: ROK family protein [Acidimicrobiales bacterium]|nr:ROK family protein [Acidimicrobiales bacterium]
MNPPGPITLGFDIGGTNIRGLALRTDQSISELISEQCLGDHDDIIQAVVRLAKEIQQLESREIDCIGIGVAGFVDNFGVVHTSPNISTFLNFPFQEKLQESFNVKVHVENDATSATWAEVQLGAARGAANVVMVSLGTGIGSGLYLDNKLFKGSSGYAGEVGHMTVVPDGLPCPCGRFGCWERYASGGSLGRLAEKLIQEGEITNLPTITKDGASRITSEHVAELVKRGDTQAMKVLEKFGYWVALGLANLVNIFDPDTVVIGGGITELGQVLLTPIKSCFDNFTPEDSLRKSTQISLARFGNRAGAVGAALLAKEAEPRS